MVDRVKGLEIFVQTVSAGSFAKGGHTMGLTRSAVGKAIAHLENRLGVRLFNRTTRGQTLTDIGQSFYEQCVTILADIDAAEAAASETAISPTGVLRVSAPVLLGRRCVAPILVALCDQHNELELELRFADKLVDLIEDRIDLAVRIGPLPDRAGQITRRIGGFDMVVCASPHYISRWGCPDTLESLGDHSCLPYYRYGGRAVPWRFSRPGGAMAELNVAGRLRFDDLNAIVDAAVSGLGITCQPAWMLQDHIEAGRLIPLLIDHRALGNDVYAVWQQSTHLTIKVRMAIDALAAGLPRILSGDALPQRPPFL